MFALVFSAAALAAAASLPPLPEVAEEAPARSGEERLVVVELFLSQACMRCPPAAARLKALSAREDILPLSWHVDYWNALSSRKNGRWVDPYAKAAFSARQRAYNLRLTGRAKVFTPQAIVAGSQSAVGSREAALDQRIRSAAADAAQAHYVRFDGETIEVAAGDKPHDIVLVTFMPEARTHVTAGANKDHVFDEANVVTGVATLAAAVVGSTRATFSPAERLKDGEDCAILLQAADLGAIAAAARCDGGARFQPASLSSSGTP